MTSSATSEEFLFFLNDLRLTHTIDIYRETGVDPETPTEDLNPPEGDCWSPAEQILHHPERRLAWHLIGGLDPGPPTWFQLAKTSLSFRARLRRAQELLRQSEALNFGKEAPELWQMLESEWQWVVQSPKVRLLLKYQAYLLGFEQPSRSALWVLTAVGRELLNVLPLRGYLCGDPAAATYHRSKLVRPFDSTPSTPTTALYLEFLRQESQGFGPLDHAAENISAMLGNTDLPDSTHQQVRQVADHLLTAWVEVWSRGEPSIEEINQQLLRLQTRFKESPPQWCVFEAIACLYSQRAYQHFEKEKFEEALRVLGVAMTYNPHDPLALYLWREIDHRIKYWDNNIPFLRGRARKKIRKSVNELSQLQQWMRLYPFTDKGQVILEGRSQAVHDELVFRLGLEPQESSSEATETLRSCLHHESLDLRNGEEFAQGVRDLAGTRNRTLAELDWEPVLAALRRSPERDIEALATALPKPECRQPAPRWLTRAKTETGPPGKSRRWRLFVGGWFFSFRDPFPKLAGALGVLLLLHGSGVGVSHWLTDNRYDAIVESVEEAEDRRTVELSPNFLERVDTNDPRASQVRSFLEEALVREVVRNVENQAEARARALLDLSQIVADRRGVPTLPEEPIATSETRP